MALNECAVSSNEHAFERDDVGQGVIIPSLQRGYAALVQFSKPFGQLTQTFHKTALYGDIWPKHGLEVPQMPLWRYTLRHYGKLCISRAVA